ARFDEEGLVKLTMEWLLRHRQTKGAETDKQLLMAIESQSFTLPKHCVDNKTRPLRCSSNPIHSESFLTG
ncbi:hypothetical protein, partial [Nitrosomonas communis]|uniref:hypothetical protein n=1 Tax=Nitrosomonas communis TaxID=44574 RepID=UPI003D275BEB